MTVRVPLARRDALCEVLVAPGLLGELPELLPRRCPAAAYAVIADDRVAALYAAPLLEQLRGAGLAAHLFPFPAGESSKTRATWIALSDAMLGARLGRDAAVVTVGGGVTTDLGGFVAATYLRGVSLVHVPTSLLAMVDAAIGGKAGVDVPAGKNLVGAFHQPRFVACDVDTLSTVPPDAFADGIAEALKHGAIADARYFDHVASHADAIGKRTGAALESLVVRSIEIKADVVAADERERGRRAILNFGHTIGHAIEAASEWTVRHGAAVAVGMVVEARVGEALGITAPGTAARLAGAAAAWGLPTSIAGAIPDDALLAHMSVDKKARAGAVRCVFLAAIGQPYQPRDGSWTVPVEASVLRAALARSRS